MATVNGVLGPIDTDALGFTLMHEHIMIANWSMRQAFELRETQSRSKACPELGERQLSQPR